MARRLASWSTLAAATERAIASVGQRGCVLILTDGVPGDVGRLTALASAYPDVRLCVVTTGRSAWGLPSDGACEWWAEELGGIDALAAAGNVRVAALRLRPDQGFELEGARPAELAMLLTGPARQRQLA